MENYVGTALWPGVMRMPLWLVPGAAPLVHGGNVRGTLTL